jgi:Tol biopolymer transport system component
VRVVAGTALAIGILGVLSTGAAGHVAGSYFPPPGDDSPVWSPDGQSIAFATTREGHALALVKANGSDERRLVERPFQAWSISPNWLHVAWADSNRLHVSRLDGSDDHAVVAASWVGGVSWAPDSMRLTFTADGAVYTVGADGSAPRRLVDGSSPAWSPDDASIAYVTSDQDIALISPGGGNVRPVVAEPGAQRAPTWSPDGLRLAFVTQVAAGKPFTAGVVPVEGGRSRIYPSPTVDGIAGLSWMPDGRSLLGGTNKGIVRLDLQDGSTTRLSRFGYRPQPSPDGSRIAFSGGGECQDRNGIVVIRASGGGQRRVTNDCRIVGTAGPDTLRGTIFADVLVGLAGNDRLFALDGNYVGDTLLGGPGDDVLSGGYWGDLLVGGPGLDKLYGGLSADQLVGGPGHDRLSGQGGQDFIYAADGARDTVICGTNLGHATPERDHAFADRFDRVAADCEFVNGRRRN